MEEREMERNDEKEWVSSQRDFHRNQDIVVLNDLICSNAWPLQWATNSSGTFYSQGRAKGTCDFFVMVQRARLIHR